MTVRGLAASKHIDVGDVVISIPLDALLSPLTFIDRDPVLGPVLGPEARRARGWDGYGGTDGYDDDDDPAATATDYEIPLLVLLVLHHRSLGSRSPLRGYVDVLRSAPAHEIMPSLWDDARLRSDASEGVRREATGVRSDARDMYDAVVKELIRDHPDVFGPPTSAPTPPPATTEGTGSAPPLPRSEPGSSREWAYSFENFRWAFAMVSSRHFLLPISDLDAEIVPPASAPTRSRDNGGGGSEGTNRGEGGHIISSVAYDPPPPISPRRST